MRFDLDLSFGTTKKNSNWELLYPICGALVILIFRVVCQKYIFTKIGLRLGLKQIEVKKAPHNAALEKAYSVSKKWKLDRVRGFAKQLDVSEEEVESWLKLRSAQDRPSVLTKFCESFWRYCYYTSAWTVAVFIVWDKPWFWDLDQCWINFRDQTVTRDVWWFIMISLSFYLSELMGMYFDVKRKDFWPMFIHHVATVVLLFFAWKCHLFRIFMVALVLLDCSDVLLELSKIMIYLGHDKTSFVTFFTFVLVWIVTRLGYFPFWVNYYSFVVMIVDSADDRPSESIWHKIASFSDHLLRPAGALNPHVPPLNPKIFPNLQNPPKLKMPELSLSRREINRLLKRALSGDIAPIVDLKASTPGFHWATLKYETTGDTILHCAARLGHIDTINYLLSFRPSSVDCKNNDDKTPLHEAAQFSQAEVVRLLLANGAQVNALKRADWTPLMLACTKSDPETVKLLVEGGALINYSNKDGWSCLHLAARQGEGEIFRFLIGQGGDHAVRTRNGRSVLHVAALHGNAEIVRVLVELGVDVDVKDNCGNTPLHEAVLGRHVAVCRLLIESGADVRCTNNVDFNLLHLASSEGYNDLVEIVVKELGFDVNAANANGLTALHCAARKGQNDTYQVLVQLGGDPEIKDKFGRIASAYHDSRN
ncbi:hypothetical protein GEV33_010437 [Tenebrio molitor]|uniref:TLC domain-containing protein n=1 Tax=Tenebrio molitor TaxID=7067 RepID=A0A8J6HDA6_TENMO|nr:hypothetical protein GEV33_010437 [Tenebrio molitor]